MLLIVKLNQKVIAQGSGLLSDRPDSIPVTKFPESNYAKPSVDHDGVRTVLFSLCD